VKPQDYWDARLQNWRLYENQQDNKMLLRWDADKSLALPVSKQVSR